MHTVCILFAMVMFKSVNANIDLVQMGLDACGVDRFCDGNISAQINTTGCCKPCSCDRSCVLSRNCCPDADINMASLPLYLDPYRRFTTCEHNYVFLPNGMTLNNMALYFKMVSKCPDGSLCAFNPSVTRLSSAVAVSHSSTGAIFINRHCASCHDVTDVVEWYLEVEQCLQGQNEILESVTLGALSLQSILANCTISTMPPEDYQIMSERLICYPLFNTECNATKERVAYSPEVENACTSGIFEILGMQIRTVTYEYRNPFCLNCNVPRDEIENYTLKYCPEIDVEQSIFSEVSSSFRLLDLNMDTSASEDEKCAVSEVFDAIQGICRLLYCPPLFRPNHGLCESIPLKPHHYRYIIVLRFALTTDGTQKVSASDLQITNAFIQSTMKMLYIRRECLLYANGMRYRHSQSLQSGIYVAVEVVTAHKDCSILNVSRHLQYIQENATSVSIAGNKFTVNIVAYPTRLNDSVALRLPAQVNDFTSRIEQLDHVVVDGLRNLIGLMNRFFFSYPPLLRVQGPYTCPFFTMNESQVCELSFVRDCNMSSLTLREHFHIATEITERNNIQFLYRICIDKYYELFQTSTSISLESVNLVSLVASSISLICITYPA